MHTPAGNVTVQTTFEIHLQWTPLHGARTLAKNNQTYQTSPIFEVGTPQRQNGHEDGLTRTQFLRIQAVLQLRGMVPHNDGEGRKSGSSPAPQARCKNAFFHSWARISFWVSLKGNYYKS